MSKMSKKSPNKEKQPKSPLKKVGQVLSTVILILCTLLCFAVVLQTALNQNSSVFGFRLFYVVTGSMEPTLPVDSLLLVQEQDDYQVGDIITYYAKDGEIAGQPNTHRIIEKNVVDGVVQYTTRGDANPIPDPQPVLPEQIIGKMCICFGAMEFIGTVLEMLSTPGGFFVIILLPLLSIALICMWEFKRTLTEEMRRAAQASLEAELLLEKEEAPENGENEHPEGNA